MTELRRFQAVDALLLLFVVIVALTLRGGYWWKCCALKEYPAGWLQVQSPTIPVSGQNAGLLVAGAAAAAVPQPGLASAPAAMQDPELSELYHHFRDDKGFVSHVPFAVKEELTAHTSPGYALLLGLLARVVDDDKLGWIVRLAQVILGALTAGLYFLFARRAFRSLSVGTLAGLFCAINPFWIINVVELADGTLASFLLAVSLFLGARGIQTGGPLSSLLYGLMLAALSLVRAACLPFAFIAVAWYLLRSRTVPRGWLCALLAFLGFVNGLVPWTVRNWQAFNEPVPIVDSAYYHLWVGNNPHATGGPATAAAEEAALEQDRTLPSLGQTQRFARLGILVRNFWRDESLKAVQLRVQAALDFMMGERWFTTGELANRAPVVVKDDVNNTETRPPMPYLESEGDAGWQRYHPGVLHAALLTMFALAFLGWRWSYGWRRESMPASLAVIWIPLPYILSHAEALSGPRLPLDGVLLCYAAFAVACMIPGIGGYLFAGSKGMGE